MTPPDKPKAREPKKWEAWEIMDQLQLGKIEGHLEFIQSRSFYDLDSAYLELQKRCEELEREKNLDT